MGNRKWYCQGTSTFCVARRSYRITPIYDRQFTFLATLFRVTNGSRNSERTPRSCSVCLGRNSKILPKPTGINSPTTTLEGEGFNMTKDKEKILKHVERMKALEDRLYKEKRFIDCNIVSVAIDLIEMLLNQ